MFTSQGVAQLKDVIERVHHVKVTLGVNEPLQAEYTDEKGHCRTKMGDKRRCMGAFKNSSKRIRLMLQIQPDTSLF